MTSTLIRRSDALTSASARNERALATNVLGPFPLTNLLIPWQAARGTSVVAHVKHSPLGGHAGRRVLASPLPPDRRTPSAER